MSFEQKPAWKEMNLLYREFDSFYHEVARSLGLSDSAFMILYCVCERGDGCQQRDICQDGCLSKQTVNSSIRKLVQDEILILESGKGRDQHIILTERGRRFVTEKIFPVMQMESDALEEMKAEERQMLMQLTHKNIDLMKKLWKERGLTGGKRE